MHTDTLQTYFTARATEQIFKTHHSNRFPLETDPTQLEIAV